MNCFKCCLFLIYILRFSSYPRLQNFLNISQMQPINPIMMNGRKGRRRLLQPYPKHSPIITPMTYKAVNLSVLLFLLLCGLISSSSISFALQRLLFNRRTSRNKKCTNTVPLQETSINQYFSHCKSENETRKNPVYLFMD